MLSVAKGLLERNFKSFIALGKCGTEPLCVHESCQMRVTVLDAENRGENSVTWELFLSVSLS